MLQGPFEWTDANAERAKELYQGGYSYSQIAAVLGCQRGSVSGFASRNRRFFPKRGSVGKPSMIMVANGRVKFDWNAEAIDRASEMWSDKKTAREMAEALGTTTGSVENIVHHRRDKFPIRGRVRSAKQWQPKTAAPVDAVGEVIQIPSIAPVSRGLTLLQLTDSTCKWPIGDPQSTDFHFCGTGSAIGAPYCVYHCRLAYQPRIIGMGGRRL